MDTAWPTHAFEPTMRTPSNKIEIKTTLAFCKGFCHAVYVLNDSHFNICLVRMLGVIEFISLRLCELVCAIVVI